MDTLANRETAGLAADLDRLPDRYTSLRRCRFGSWVRTLPPDDRAAVWRAVRSNRPYRMVAEAITRNGYVVSGSTVNNHRIGACNSCNAEASS